VRDMVGGRENANCSNIPLALDLQEDETKARTPI
jgi:hypothetical protein